MVKITIGASSPEKRRYAASIVQSQLGLLTVGALSSFVTPEDAKELIVTHANAMHSEPIEIIEAKDDQTAEEMLNLVQYKMTNGIAHFLFKKTDGTMREAYGTTNSGFIPSAKMKYFSEIMDLLHAAKTIGKVDPEVDNSYDIMYDDLMGRMNAPTQARTPSDTKISFYDMEANAWKAFVKDAIVKVF